MQPFVSGDEKRIFINTAIGCSCKCAYCYLEEIGIQGKPIIADISMVMKQLLENEYFQKGSSGTILSIGCYSECWDEENKQNTITLLKEIVKYGNYIQIATKKEMTEEEVLLLDEIALYQNQIGIYVSAPTISKSREIEIGTDTIKARLSVLRFAEQVKRLYFVLYIKPVLSGITILDIDKYTEIVKKFPVKCIVGSLLQPTRRGNQVQLIGSDYFYKKQIADEEILIEELAKVQKIYIHSTDIIEEIRSKRGWIE